MSSSLSSSYEEMKKRMRDDKAEELERLKLLCKPLEQLVVSEKFTVAAVLSSSHGTRFLSGPIAVGGHNPTEDGGHMCKTEIMVTPLENASPVKKLMFNGFSAARAGDTIVARIPRYKVEETYWSERDKKFYSDRPYKEEEEAIEILFFSSKEGPLRRERSITYKNFVKAERD